MVKKSISVLLTVLFCIFMVSCGENSSTKNKNKENSDQNDSDSEEVDDSETSDSPASEDSDNENNGTETDEENDGDTEENDSETSDSEESGDEDSGEPWHKESTVVEPTAESEMKTEALIVTTNEFKEVFQKFANFHTVTGIGTKVVTVEDICKNAVCDDSDAIKDTQKAIKDYVMSVEGLKYLILGGDIDDIPSREVHDHFELPLGIADYTDDFYSDLYYADFSEWDSNGNGIYAEDDGTGTEIDTPDLIADVAIGRISVSTVDEAELYLSKLVKHHTAFNTEHTQKSLLIANIATEISGVKVNAGYYFESAGKTVSLISPDYSMKKLYTQSTPYPGNGTAQPLDNTTEKAAIEEGVNLIVHSGHGGQTLLTCEQGTDPDRDFTAKMAYELKNETLPFFLSCACEAGQFAYTRSDSAGEKLMKAPEGGAIVYLGNTTTGLGIAGGSQFIDEMLRNMFMTSYSTIGESYLFAHLNMFSPSYFTVPLINKDVQVVNPDSWRWTKKSIVMLGDPMTVFWRDKIEPFTAGIEPEVEENDGIKTVSFQFTPDLEGISLRVFADGKLYDVPYVMYETIKINLDSKVEKITVGIKAEDSQFFFKEFDI